MVEDGSKMLLWVLAGELLRGSIIGFRFSRVGREVGVLIRSRLGEGSLWG